MVNLEILISLETQCSTIRENITKHFANEHRSRCKPIEIAALFFCQQIEALFLTDESANNQLSNKIGMQ